MKNVLPLISIVTLSLSASAAPFLVPSNPPPVVQLAWTPAPNTTNTTLYYGVGSGQYTNKTLLGATNGTIVTLPARGVTYFFAVTDTQGGLESGFSSEVSYTPAVPPAPPSGMLPPVTLVVQTKNSPQDFMWVDTGMSWSVDPTQPEALFRLDARQSFAVAPQIRKSVSMPPLPGQ